MVKPWWFGDSVVWRGRVNSGGMVLAGSMGLTLGNIKRVGLVGSWARGWDLAWCGCVLLFGLDIKGPVGILSVISPRTNHVQTET